MGWAIAIRHAEHFLCDHDERGRCREFAAEIKVDEGRRRQRQVTLQCTREVHGFTWISGYMVHWPQTLLAGGEGLPGRTPSPAKAEKHQAGKTQAEKHQVEKTQAEKHQVPQVQQRAQQQEPWYP